MLVKVVLFTFVEPNNITCFAATSKGHWNPSVTSMYYYPGLQQNETAATVLTKEAFTEADIVVVDNNSMTH